MLGGQFRGRIRAKPEASKLGTLTKTTNVRTLKKESQAKVNDVLGRPKKSLVQETKAEVKKAEKEEAVRVQEKKEKAEVEKRAETSKITSSESFLNKLSSVLGIKKSALKVKDKETILADTNTKISELKENAVKNADAEAKVAKEIKLEENKNVLTQKVNDLNQRITGLKNNFFSNINNIFIRASQLNRIRDNESGRVDKLRGLDAETKAKRAKDSDTKDGNAQKNQNKKSDTAKDDSDFIPLERVSKLGDDSVNVKKKAKDAKDDATNQTNKDNKKIEKNEKDGTTKADNDANNLANPNPRRRGLESEEQKVKAKTAEKDAKSTKDGDESTTNRSNDESTKTKKAKDDSDDLANPRKEVDSDTAKKKAKDADDDAKRSKDGDAEGKKKDGDERNKTEEAEGDARKLKDTDDSRKVREDAENQRKKDSDQNKKAKDENSKFKKLFDALNKLSNLLGLISTILTIINIVKPPQPPVRSFCELNPNHPSCISICRGPLCGVIVPPVGPTTFITDVNNFTPSYAPTKAPTANAPFAFPEIKGVISYLLFTLQNRPEKDITVLLEPNDENIKFNESLIVFTKDKWDETVRIPFYISVPDLSGNEEFESTTVEEKVKTIRKKKKQQEKIRPRIKKDPVSLEAYYPSKLQIDTLARRLKFLLNKSDTDLEKALQQIHENIRIKRQLGIYETVKKFESDGDTVVPTFDSSYYQKIQEDVEPTYDDKDYKTLDTDTIEPTYSDSEYKEYKEDVEPTYDINPSKRRVEFEPSMVMKGGEEYEEEYEEDATSDELPDEYKAYFTMRLVENTTFDFDIEVICESLKYQTDPDFVSFNKEIPANEVAVFSSETFNLVSNTFQINNAVERTEEFNEDINNQYINEYEDILEEREYADAEADDIYNETYNRSLSNTNRRISEAEYLRNQLQSGGKYRYFTRKNDQMLSAK
jgi:hypothetical protein